MVIPDGISHEVKRMRGKNIIWLSLVALLLINTMTGVGTSLTTAKMYVDPASIEDPTKTVNSIFTVNVKVAVDNLYAWEFTMFFNPSIVQAMANISIGTLGTFLNTAGTTIVLAKKINNTAGYVVASEMLWPRPPQGASGSGTLAKVSFKVVGVGVTALDLTKTKLITVISGVSVPLEHLAEDGVFDNRPVNQPPVAIFTVTPPIGTVGTQFTFDASASHDDGWIVSYFWDFGDGTNATDKIVQKTWIAGTEGTYVVNLIVTDNNGVSRSAQYTLTVLGWMQAGDHPDLVNTLIWLEHPVFEEVEDGEHETLWAKVGNPTDKSYQVRVDFDIFSKDEGRKLGTISTAVETIDSHKKMDIPADFFLGDYRWATTTGPYNWPYWVKKYWAIGRCFYLNETTGQWKAGIFPGANQFKVHPVVHDRAIIAMSANYNLTNPAHVGGTVVIQVTLENQGQQIEHDIPLTLEVYGVGTIGTATTTLGVGETQTFTFNWVVPADITLGNTIIIAKTPAPPDPYSHPYERDITDNTMYIVIAVA